MKTLKIILPCFMMAGLVSMTGCPSDDEPGTSGTDTDQATDTATATMTATMTATQTATATETQGMTDSQGMTDTVTATMTATATESGTDTEGETDTDTTGPDPSIFMFREDPPEAYTQVDRMGFPVVNTALISADNKDAYNQASPADDLENNAFDMDIRASLVFLHVGIDENDDNTGLDDDLDAAGFTPCDYDAGVGMIPQCEQQAAPFIVPDVLNLDTAEAGGFPNGRMPADVVMDPILAVVLLDLGTEDLTAFADIPMNPVMNDVEFPAGFPYLAPAHE